MSGCGVTSTLYGNKVAAAVENIYGKGPDGAHDTLPVMRGGVSKCGSQAGGCGCLLGAAPQAKRNSTKARKMRGGYPGCTGQPTMLRALGIMAGGSKRKSRRMTAGACGACSGLPRFLRGGKYRATQRNKEILRKWRAGKSIGFTARSSLKAKGLIPRANGTLRVSPKYK
jgi:hypothetical protein